MTFAPGDTLTSNSGHVMDGDDLVLDGADIVIDFATVTAGLTVRSTVQVTGVASSDLSFIWSHKRRLWFVERGTLSAWYLPVNSIGGAASEFPLDGVFRLGGALLFGGTWSQDSGDGLDDLAVFVTTEGEIAVYQGTNPSDANAWALVGVYLIGKPLGKNAWFRAGGDLVILTEDGIVPVSEALMKDRAALQAAAITAPIEDLWQQSVAARQSDFRFSVALWSSKTALFIGVPTLDDQLGVIVANTRTGAWATITGWPATCFAVYRDRLFFGSACNCVVQADVTGSDMDGDPYVGRYLPAFQEFSTTGDKIALHGRAIYRSAEAGVPAMAVFANYQVGTFPPENPYPPSAENVWGTGIWGSSVWGSTRQSVSRTQWQSVSGSGFSLSLGHVVGSSSVNPPTFEIIGTVLRYETGRSI